MTGLLREHYRWVIVGLLFLLSVVNYLDRQTLSVLAPGLRDRFGMSTEQYSYVVIAFLVAYSLGFACCGPILDRFGVKRALGIAVLFWSLAGILHAFVSGWIGLAIARFGLGIGESFGPTGGTKAIGEWTPRTERGLSMAVFSTGNVAGAVLAPPLVTLILVRFGWQAAFVVTGVTGLLWLLLWTRFYGKPENHPRVSDPERTLILNERGAVTPSGGILALLRTPACYGLFFARLLTDPLPYFFSFWLPEYLHRSRAMTAVMIGMVAWIPYVAADIGGLTGGAASDRLIRRGMPPRRARLTVLFAAACITPLAVAAVRVRLASVAIACIALVLAAHSAWIVNLLTTMTEFTARSQVGTVVAISGLGGSIGGIIANLITGRVLASYGYGPVFTTLGFVHLAAFLTIVTILQRDKSANLSLSRP